MKLKIFLLVSFGWLSFQPLAQFEVDTFAMEDFFGAESQFPLIRSDKNFDAAERINTLLHYRSLEKVYIQEDQERFSAVFPKEDEFGGAAEFSFEVLANNPSYFSIAIECSYTGAYTEYFTEYFLFDAKSGQPIYLDDLFSETARIHLSDWVITSILNQIESHVASLDRENPDEFADEKTEMYDECTMFYEEFQELSNEGFYLTDSTITFVKPRCSNHMMAALDDLWDFHETYPLKELQPLTTDLGNALLNGQPIDFTTAEIPMGKVLEGTIGKFPITMILHQSYDTYFSGVYWYHSTYKLLKLQGQLESDKLLLQEFVNDQATGSLELSMGEKGALVGKWKSPNGEKVFPIQLKIGQ